MKKMTVIMIVLMMVVFSAAKADSMDNWERHCKASDDLEAFIQENNYYEYFNNELDEYGIYGCTGLLDIDMVENECHLNANWDDVETWFVDWYREELMKRFPEFGKVAVMMTKAGIYNDTTIWHITIVGTGDLMDSVSGVQNTIDMMGAFY